MQNGKRNNPKRNMILKFCEWLCQIEKQPRDLQGQWVKKILETKEDLLRTCPADLREDLLCRMNQVIFTKLNNPLVDGANDQPITIQQMKLHMDWLISGCCKRIMQNELYH